MQSTPCQKEARPLLHSLQLKIFTLQLLPAKRLTGMCIAGDLLQLKRAVQAVAQSAGQGSASGLQPSAREALQYLATVAAG